MSEAGVFSVIVIFYVLVSVMVGFTAGYLGVDTEVQNETVNQLGFFEFIVSGFQELPVWFNTLIFAPLIAILIYIGIKLLPFT